LTVSVQFGQYNYCAVRTMRDRAGDHVGPGESSSAEIAAWDASGEWYQFEGSTVDGYKSPAEVLAFMQTVAAL
jgi:hypothetical protein